MVNSYSRVDFLLKQIDVVLGDVENKSLEEFSKSDLLVRATCFSIMQIGEQMNRLRKEFGDKYPEIPWDDARDLRILIVHIYNKVDSEQIYKTAINDLPILKEAFLGIKNNLESN